MARSTIPKDATITVIRGRLRDPDRYVRGVLGNLILCRKQYGSAVVRIGTSGEGRAPHYRVQPEETYVDATLRIVMADTADDMEREEQKANVAHYTAYHGVSHKTLQWGKGELQDYSWSSRWMTLDQVQALLGDIRGLKPKAI